MSSYSKWNGRILLLLFTAAVTGAADPPQKTVQNTTFGSTVRLCSEDAAEAGRLWRFSTARMDCAGAESSTWTPIWRMPMWKRLNSAWCAFLSVTVSPAFSPSATHIAPPCIILIRQKGPLRLASLLKTRPGAPSFDQKWIAAIRLQSDESCKPYSGLEVEWRVREKKRRRSSFWREASVVDVECRKWDRWNYPVKKKGAFDFVVILSDCKTKDKGAAS